MIASCCQPDRGAGQTQRRLDQARQSFKQPVAGLATNGPVVSISSGEALRADTVVVFNLSTGNYEVYRVSLACGL